MTDRYLWAMGFAVEKEVTGTLSIGSRTDDDDDAKKRSSEMSKRERGRHHFFFKFHLIYFIKITSLNQGRDLVFTCPLVEVS